MKISPMVFPVVRLIKIVYAAVVSRQTVHRFGEVLARGVAGELLGPEMDCMKQLLTRAATAVLVVLE